MITFNTDNMVQQIFPFPAPVMDYIFKNISAPQLLKLYKTCKFFYDKFRLNIIEDFEICESKENEQNTIGNLKAIWYQNSALSKLNNLWISKSFTYCACKEFILDYNKFSRLTCKRLGMIGISTVADYEFLIKSPVIRHLTVTGAIYYPETDLHLSVEEIIDRAPHVSAIDLYHSREDFSSVFPPIDMAKLIAMERQTKLSSLHLYDVSKVPDPLLVIKFFKKHATPDIDYFFEFDESDDEYDPENIKAFYKTIDAELRAWKTALQIPPTISSSFIDLTGKTAVVTGASDGIGRATVILFRQLGASVIAISRHRGHLKTLVNDCQNIKNAGFLHTLWIPLILSVNVVKVFERIVCKYGTKFDILVNNADTSSPYFLNIESEKQYCYNKRVRLMTHHRLVKKAKSFLIEAKGNIVNVSNSVALITEPEDEAAIAKLEQRIKTVEEKLLSSGVRVNTVCREATVPALPRPDGMTDNVYKKYLKESKKSDDERAANSIAFLASDAAKLINESTLNNNTLCLH